MAMTGTPLVHADGFSYLTFETADGAKASVPVAEPLAITVVGNTLTVGTKTFTLSNLSKMYFTDADETATGISETSLLQTDDLLQQATEIYDLKGGKTVNANSSNRKLPRGVYIVKTKQETYKIVVK